MDGEVHQASAGMHNYSTFPLWDTYRATHPLYNAAIDNGGSIVFTMGSRPNKQFGAAAGDAPPPPDRATSN